MLANAPDYVRTSGAIQSGFRGPGEQAKAIQSVAQRNGIPFSLGLLRTGIKGMAAPVGGSRHETGEAVDFNTTDPKTRQWLHTNAPRFGVSFPLPKDDSGHGELDRGFVGPVVPYDLDNPPPADRDLAEGDRVQLGEYQFDVWHLPGHAPGHVCYHLVNEKVLIGGDLIIGGAIGRTDLPDSDAAKLAASVRKVMQLPDDTTLLGGHGEPSTLGEERTDNPYVRAILNGI
jgi:hypothetical protein